MSDKNKSENKSELTNDQQEGLMREALAEAERGMAEGETPTGCALTLGSGPDLRVVARGHNRVSALGRKTAHAETMTFENAAVTMVSRPPCRSTPRT